MAKTAKEKLIDLIRSEGWVPDPTQTIRVHASRFGLTEEQTPERKQHPHAFMKRAAHGGTWRLFLDYTNRSSYHGGFGNTLKSAHINWADDRGDRMPMNGLSTLKNVENITWGKASKESLWEALKFHGKDGEIGTLGGAVKLLVTDPDTSVWLAAQWSWDKSERLRIAEEKAEALRQAKAQPLPVVVTQQGYGSEWGAIARKLEYAARDIARADGTSDLPQLVADAQLALEGIQSALTDEAREVSEAIVGEAHHKLWGADAEALRKFLTGADA